MHPIFYGFGPAFRQNIRAKSFHSVDMYPLMSYILGLKPRVTNGSLANTKHILKNFSDVNYWKKINFFMTKIIELILNWDLTSKYSCS